MDKTLKYDNPDSQKKIRQIQVIEKSTEQINITQAMNSALVANQCNHQVLQIG